MMPVSSEIKPALESVFPALEKAGAKLQRGWPPDVSSSELLSTYLFMLSAFTFSVTPVEQQEKQRAAFAVRVNDPIGPGSLADFASWQLPNLRRLAFRAAWQRYFQSFDAFLLPALRVAAFPHDHSEQSQRTLATPEGRLPYLPEVLAYMSVANPTGCPATVMPAGRTASGLPVGIQIPGPYLEDWTPIRLAALLAKENGGFTPPPGY